MRRIALASTLLLTACRGEPSGDADSSSHATESSGGSGSSESSGSSSAGSETDTGTETGTETGEPSSIWYDEELIYEPEDTAVELEAFLAEHGGVAAFGQQAVAALTAYLSVEDLFRANDSAGADAVLDELWASYPIGDASWGATPWTVNGAHIGYPSAYYGLREFSDLAAHRLAGGGAGEPLYLSIVLVGCAEGTQATTLAELENGGGVEVSLSLDERTLDTDPVFGQATWPFTQYVEALTQGGASLIARVAYLPDVCLPIQTVAAPTRVAGVTTLAPLWDAMPAEITEQTDWWWVLYPSAVPEQYPELANLEFITGGMATHPAGGPVFLSDDRWVLRIPPHMGNGDWSNVERRTYFPQWLQHELFHFIFALYPEFGLEAQPHQWFDLGTWPLDFVGRYEPDYYAESLYKRIWGAEPPLASKLRFRPPPSEAFDWVDSAAIVGNYSRLPIENEWHDVAVVDVNGALRWQNAANVSWGLSYAGGSQILTGDDCPYDSDVVIELAKDPQSGSYLEQIAGLRFNGELYVRE